MHAHDEEMTPQEFAAEEASEEFEFGPWTEIVGLLAAAGIVWLMFASSQGAF